MSSNHPLPNPFPEDVNPAQGTSKQPLANPSSEGTNPVQGTSNQPLPNSSSEGTNPVQGTSNQPLPNSSLEGANPAQGTPNQPLPNSSLGKTNTPPILGTYNYEQESLKYNKWLFWTQAIGLCCTVIGLSFVGCQIQGQIDALESSTYQGMVDKMIELDKIFIENPKIRPYIFEGQILAKEEIKKNIDKEKLPEKEKQEKKEKIDETYNKILAISDYQLDFFEMLLDQRDYIEELRKGKADWNSWVEYMKYSFKKNRMLCEHYQKVKHTYSINFQEFIQKYIQCK